MNKITQNNQNGFTLIEVMTAMAIFAIGILGVAKMQLLAIEGNSNARGLTEASNLAQNKMEELISLAYDDPDLVDSDGDGTGKDADNNGFDDDTNDDKGNNFGLRDPLPPLSKPQFPDPAIYPPDHSSASASGIYTLYWNIAVNEPVDASKRICVHVVWRQNGVDKHVTLNSVKVVI